MHNHDALRAWLLRGKQRRAVAQALQGVMSGIQLWKVTVGVVPKMALRDMGVILKDMQHRGLCVCLNPDARSGRLFAPTPLGEEIFQFTFPNRPASAPMPCVEPMQLAQLLRARVRRAVFEAIACPPLSGPSSNSASRIKRRLRETCPITLNQAIRSVTELERFGMIRTLPKENRYHTYALTPAGEDLVAFLQKTQSTRLRAISAPR